LKWRKVVFSTLEAAMTDPRGAVIFLICLGVLTLLLALTAIGRRVWWTEFVQERKLRWTGESSYLPYLPFRDQWTPRGRHLNPSAPGVVGGSLPASPSPGTRRMLAVRAQTPADAACSQAAAPAGHHEVFGARLIASGEVIEGTAVDPSPTLSGYEVS
jgi:hypothetical protein